MDSVDKGCQSVLVVGWAIICGIPGSFGLCWLLTWFFNIRGFRERFTDSADLPLPAVGLLVGSIVVFSYVYGKLHEYDNN